MSTVEDFLHSRWHRIRERVIVLSCLKALSKDQPRRSDRLKRKRLDGDEVVALQGTAAYKFIPPLCEFFSGEVASITTSFLFGYFILVDVVEGKVLRLGDPRHMRLVETDC
jgi:hypothetical protein